MNIYSKGYGYIPKLVMQDKRLSIYAKAIYAYFCSYSVSGAVAFPSPYTVMSDLGMSSEMYREHFGQLISYGYISLKREKIAQNKTRNIYSIEENVST